MARLEILNNNWVVLETDNLFSWELWDAINTAAGGDDCWSIHNKTLHYSHLLNEYKYRNSKKFLTKNGEEINGSLELVIQFQKDYTLGGTPVFVVPLTKELHSVLNTAVDARGEYAHLYHDNENVVVYTTKDGDLSIVYTSWIEGKYDSPQYNAFRQMVEKYNGKATIIRPGLV